MKTNCPECGDNNFEIIKDVKLITSDFDGRLIFGVYCHKCDQRTYFRPETYIKELKKLLKTNNNNML